MKQSIRPLLVALANIHCVNFHWLILSYLDDVTEHGFGKKCLRVHYCKL